MRANDRKYIETHEWCKISDGVATLGITDFAVAQLSDLVFLDLPVPGTWVCSGRPFGEIESVKAVFNLIAPVGGKLLEVNDDLVHNLKALAVDPFDAWIIKVKLGNEMQDMMDAEAYEQHCIGTTE